MPDKRLTRGNDGNGNWGFSVDSTSSSSSSGSGASSSSSSVSSSASSYNGDNNNHSGSGSGSGNYYVYTSGSGSGSGIGTYTYHSSGPGSDSTDSENKDSHNGDGSENSRSNGSGSGSGSGDSSGGSIGSSGSGGGSGSGNDIGYGYGNDGNRSGNGLCDNNRAFSNDVRVLNFALTLEHLAESFYNTSLSRLSQEDFRNAGYPDWVRGRYLQIKDHEQTHVRFLHNAIRGSGAAPVERCEYRFPDCDVKQFIELSVAIETVASSAYNGALSHLHNGEYIAVFGSMMGVEARRAAWINSAVKKQNPWNTAFETPITFNQAWSIAKNFISSCPFNEEGSSSWSSSSSASSSSSSSSSGSGSGSGSGVAWSSSESSASSQSSSSSSSSSALLPEGLRAFPPLHLPGLVEAGTKIEISFQSTDFNREESIFAAFIIGTGTFIERVGVSDSAASEGVVRGYVKVPKELKAKGAVYFTIVRGSTRDEKEVRVVGDENMVAGPALVMFPFNSWGKAEAESEDQWAW
ncbi:hypothetical protein H1R20_g15802, partial [Candolleomyces eurysporus]